MSKEVLDYKLPYTEKGLEYLKTIKISFVSNKVLRMYNEHSQILVKLDEINRKKQLIMQELAEIIVDKKMKIKEKMELAKVKKEEERQLNLELKDLNDAYMFSEKWKIIKRVLDDNGIDDEKLNDPDFWDENTDPSTPWGFLTKCIMKDIPQEFFDKEKKKILTKISSLQH
jgi:seryl-tRNA synthetase